ncbi:MAG: cupredoxin family copper-binding protein [Candidatus Aenigmarchaeota archaeon]|nr:cupredoxin family copper-binding protein [Candidatus Aenigmarchaeota archaeon]
MKTNKLLIPIALILVVAVLVVSGCVQQQGEANNTVSGDISPKTVTIKNFAFDPAGLSIKTGTIVNWVNEDSAPHTATLTGIFDSGILNTGQSFSYTFNIPGTYDYICTLHPSMRARVIVEPA